MNYYNEHDPKAAAWLRELIRGGHIAAGDVDERNIKDVRATDLLGYSQYHLFAGIGGWPVALRLAGWPDDRPIGTGSCPCPPFSSAGKKKSCPRCAGKRPLPCPRRTGYFICIECEHAWFADERHLWPEMYRFVRDTGVSTWFGEQVAGADGRLWFAGVRATLERIGYVVGAADLAAAGVGAPHIRQRLYWVADAESVGRGAGAVLHKTPEAGHARFGDRGRVGRLGDTNCPRSFAGQFAGASDGHRRSPLSNGHSRGLADVQQSGLEGHTRHGDHGYEPGRIDPDATRSTAPSGGAWDSFDLLPCTDGKARRVEPGTFPLAHGVSGRVGLLRGYGNAIVPQIAAEFIGAWLEAKH